MGSHKLQSKRKPQTNISSKVSKTNFKNKPLGWYFHRAMCWIGWQIRHIDYWHTYHKHLKIMCNKYRINYYGDKH
jgi:hypothetical protein